MLNVYRVQMQKTRMLVAYDGVFPAGEIVRDNTRV